jgi:hypothetical protein
MTADDGRDPEAIAEALDECEHEVDQLKRENKLLRDASRTFGALAERLNATLATERRRNTDRRAQPRPTEDRRRQEQAAGERTRG